MKPTTREWVEKAEADWTTALAMRRSRKPFSRDIVCFHVQQCLEKYLKARLEEAAVGFPRIHDLERLLDLTLPVEPLWTMLRPALVAVTAYAVEFRYPGRTATTAEARAILKDATHIRGLVRRSLGLKP